MSKIPAINEIDANSPSQESTEVVVKATTVTPDINEIQETISASATIQEIDGTRKPTISEIYKIVNDGLFESTTNWWDYAYKLSQAQINQDIISRLDNGVIGGGYSKGVDIITTTSNKVPSNTNVYSALKSDSIYPKKLNNEDINGIYDFLNGLTIGKPTAYTGGTWSVDKLGKTHLTTDYLYVRLKAIFETLQILNVDTIGGKLVISPAGSIRVAYVDRIKIDAPVFKHDEKTDVWSIPQIKDDKGNLVNETLNQEVYRCYFLGEQEGEKIENKWKVGDQAQAKSFNVKKGTYHKTGNHYLWRLVVGVSTDTVDIDGKKYHYVDLSQLIFDVGSDAPAPGDVLNQLGHKGEDLQRQTAIVLNAVDNYAPSITLYAGINDFTLLNKEYVDYGVYQGKAFFNVYGDMYVGDKGANPKTYIKFKNGKIDIKANLTIGSSIDGKDLDKYIKENGGVDEKTVISLINNSQVIKDLQNQADGAIETWFYEGEPTLKNLPAVDWTTNDIKKIHVGDLYYDQITGYAYRFTKYNDDVKPYDWNRIKDNDVVKALEAANKAQATADSKMKIFYGETKPTNYQAGDMWVNATLAGKFDNDIARSTTTSKTFNADHWVLASRYSEAIQTLLNWSNQYTTKFEDLTKIVKEQKDQSIANWFYDYEPTDANAPANLWNTEELRKEHIGDIFYDTKNNHSYRWTGSAWSMIKDADFDEAMKKAKDAEDLADKKRQIFYSDTTPAGADRGDLWMKQVGNKTEVWVFDGTNWVKSNDKALADYSEAINKELKGIKGQLDGKAETWYQADDPSTNWTNKTSHEGDIWYNTTNGTTQYWNGTAWEKMDIPKDVFDTIDGKSSIFVDSYADAKAGKGVISKGYNERDIWILPADAIVNGVQYYKGDILTATADRTEFNEKDWTKKVRYVGDVELTDAISKVNKKINDISATTLPGLNDKFNEFAKDGIIDSSEKARLTDLLNQANNEVLAVNDQITSIIKSDYLAKDNANKGKLIEAQKTLSTAWTEYKTLIDTLVASTSPITKNNIAEASTKYTNLQNSIKAVKQYLAACQADILSNIGVDINSYKYLKEAFKGKTEVNGGLVVTNVLQLRQTSDVNSPITAGISGLQGKADENGVVDKDTYDITSIAAWFGGPMVDKNIFTDEQLKNKVAGTDYARSLFRHDGSGYLSSGAIYWGTDGILHGNPNSFILQGTSLATMFNYIRLFHLHYANTNDEGITGVDYITPTKTFSRLDILTQGGTEAGLNLPTGLFIGNATTGGSFQVGNVIIRTKDGDPNILEIVSADSKKTAHLGVQGGVSAYGTYTPSTGGGGGLNAGVVSYANIIAGNYSDTDFTTIPNAYSIKALYNAIQNIDVTSQLGNYLLKTDAADTYQPKGNYLTTHQTIYGLTIQKNGANLGTYNPKSKAATINVTVPTKISELSNDSGYTNNIGTVTSVGLTLPTGLTCSTKSITTSGTFAVSFASGYSIPTITKQTSWDSAVSVKHSHSNKSVLDGISSAKVTHWDSAYNWYSLMTTDEETADGIINKWNEVVNFLANITQTDTLSGIINGINTSISNEVSRAKKAEGTNASNISANKTNITTLQGYFTNGSAKKALQLTTARKLWGNDFNGTTDINGSIVLPNGKYISIGNIKLEYDATNKALKITNTTTDEVANLYASGGVSAYGVGSATGSGGLQGSIISYNNAISSDPGDESSKIASASSIYKLHSRISEIENNGATSITVTGTGNAITSVIKNGTSITFTKGATFLTSHQSLANCVQTVTTTGSGNAVTDISKSGSTITVTKGATFLTSHQSLANYYTKSSVDSLLSGKSETSHTHSVKINGVTKTIAASGGTAVDLGTYLTSHQSLANYYTKSSVDSLLSGKSETSHTHSVKINGVTKTIAASGGTAVDLGTYLTSHQSLANYVTINDSRLTNSRHPKFDNNTWYSVGDDAYIGDHNIGGTFCIKSADSVNVSGIAIYNSDETKVARLWFDNTNINLDKQLVMNNKRIWIQGVGTAGGNNNRLTLVAGMPSGLVFNTSCRGTMLYSNGIAFADPYNGNNNNDSGWIRHLETSKNTGTLEIAVGNDNSNEEIHFRWYDTTSTSEHIGNDITVPRATGTLALTSQIPTTLPANGGNADKLDGYHANGLLTALSNSDKGISITVGGTTKSVSNISVNYASSAGNADTVDGYHANGLLTALSNSDKGISITVGGTVYGWIHTNEGHNNFHESYGDIINIQGFSTWRTRFDIGTSGRIRIMHGINTTTATQVGYLAFLHDNVASATKLHTPRTIWGQSFDGTGNVSGSLSGVGHIQFSADNSYSIGTTTSEAAHTYTRQVWARHLNASRVFAGDTNLYIGYSNTAQIKFFSGTKQSGDGSNERMTISTNGNVGIGIGSPAYKLHVLGNILSSGNITSSSATINGTTTINGQTNISSNLSVGGLIINQGILPANSGFNNKGANCVVSADALCSGITAITDSIPVDKVTIQYSNNNGSSWNNLNITNDNKFKMYTNSTGINTIYLGNNFISGSTNAEKLSQVKKNELMFSFYFPNSCYSQIYFACVDISNGVNTTCTVEIVKENGEIVDTYTKEMAGWNKFNYINFASTDGNYYPSAGNSNRRVVRFRFKHNQNTTYLRNASINKIRIFAFTKYSFPIDRFMGHTGHIYNFDYNMNTYFPNGILAKGGVTAYQSSDVRLKTNINKLNCLNVIKSIGGTYEFDYIRDNKHSIGFIAQNVNNPLLKDIVAKDDDGYLKINYWNPKLISLAFGALTEIDDEVDKLKARVIELENEVEYLKNKAYALQ
nr:MAG TPA: endosialidase chaperone [Crassvirales sp.]